MFCAWALLHMNTVNPCCSFTDRANMQAWEGRLAWISGITGYIPVHGDGLPTQQQPPTGRESSWRWPQLQWRWPGSQQLYVPIPSHATEVSPVPETSRMGLPQPAQQDQAGPDRLAEPKASAGMHTAAARAQLIRNVLWLAVMWHTSLGYPSIATVVPDLRVGEWHGVGTSHSQIK